METMETMETNEETEKHTDNLIIDEESSIIEVIENDKTATKKIDKRIKNPDMINKRIDFNQKTFRKLEIMIPLYRHKTENTGQNEVMSYIIEKAINKFFDEEFKKIVENL